ncbi:type I restriction endonuclease subunit R [Natroniella sp. ANB-PHB2]|uniref:type I restriction endonuclease subunit R n=1 Tax=Natroniella sp. ANB-PHB2 TaxID=3384444 RepID=UPI0038D41AA8
MEERAKYYEEDVSQQPAIDLLKSLGYKYLSPSEATEMRGNLYNVLLTDVLKEQLQRLNSFEYKGEEHNFSKKNIEQAIKDLDEPLTDGLVKTNEKIYDHLMVGKSYEEHLPDGNKSSFSINYIDWENPENNVYHVVDEFSVERADGRGNKRPDIVLFVNGIPFVVIECKRSSISVKEGIEQTIDYQSKEKIPHLYKYIQIVMATNKNETKYGTCATQKKFWSLWREEYEDWLQDKINQHITGRMPTHQDKRIISLFSPKRLVELTKYFVVFDKNEKKIARYQQYFAVKETIKSITTFDKKGNRQGGVIWHTQGSGKSLTMVMLSKYILENISESRVVVVTDRINLDKQIRKTFKHTRLKPNRATSGQNLIDLIEDNHADIITTVVNKFETASKKKVKIESRNIFILVDESHRSQYGELHTKMRLVFPNACYLGFTGTPLMKKEKNTMVKFGRRKPIHTYTIADGVEDNTIVPLLYEGKMVEQTVNKRAIDNRLEMITRHLNDEQTEEVKQKWSRFKKIATSDQRIKFIAFDINDHFLKNYKTDGCHFKAMLATNGKIEAIRYLEAFEELSDLKAAVVISPPDQKEGKSEVDRHSKNKIQNFWNRMMKKYSDKDDYEESIKDDFKNGDLDLLIVVDKLLTGFDAPKASVLYIDKQMREHTLLQAIARVNRIYEGKDYGYIVDYMGLIRELDEAMQMYSGSGLENFDPKDLQGALYDVKTIIGKLREAHSQLLDIFIPVKNKEDMEEYEVRLANEELREEFYEVLSKFSRNLSIALQSERIYKELGREKLNEYKKDLKFFQELRKSVKLRYSDEIDHEEYEVKMQKLMDNYIASEEVVRITNPVDVLNEKGFEEELERLGTPRAKADAIRTRLSKRIDIKMNENPAFYKKFSEKVKETLAEYKEKRISDDEYFKKMKDIKNDFKSGKSGVKYPKNIKQNKDAQAFYGATKEIIERNNDLDNEEVIGEIALEVDEIIAQHSKVDWHDNIEVHKRIEQELDDLLFKINKESDLDLSLDQIDEIIDNVKVIALRRY